MAVDFDEALSRWEELQEVVPRLQAEERALREEIIKAAFPEIGEGTNKLEMPGGRTLKAVGKVYRNVDTEAAQGLGLDPDTMSRLFRTKLELRKRNYDDLDTPTKKKVDKVVTLRPGLATLTIVEPKADALKIG